MYTIKVKDWLERDFDQLKEEYLKEDKDKYRKMFADLVFINTREKLKRNELEGYSFQTEEVYFPDFKWGISIIVELYMEVTPYFYSICNLEEWGVKLRQNTEFRDFTKLCFYIVETVKPK